MLEIMLRRCWNGADLYESYCGASFNRCLGAVAFKSSGLDVQFIAVIAPMVIAAVGIILSILGIFLVKPKKVQTKNNF